MAKKPAESVELSAAMRVLVVYGKERFIMQERTRLLIDALQAKFGEIEQFSFDGETASPAAILDELRSYGLLQRHKLVILDNADVFLAGGKAAARAAAAAPADENEDEQDDESPVEADDDKKPNPRRPLFEKYAQNPVADATLLMRAESWRKGNLDKHILKGGGAIIACEEVPAFSAVGWCAKRVAKRHQATIAQDAAELLVQRHGTSLQHLDTELAKLAAMAGGGGVITRQLVAENTNLSREEKVWEIQSAVATGDPARMLAKLKHQLETSTQSPQSTIIPMTWAIVDLLRKAHAAAHLSRRGVPPGGIFSQLKLWGDTGAAIIGLGQRLESRTIAQLLRAAVRTDQHNKSGVGEPVRNLERLMVQIADAFRSAQPAA